MRVIMAVLACAVSGLAMYRPETPEEQADRLAAFRKLVDQVRYNPTPAPNNPDLDCNMRELAYLFALKIQPQRAPLRVMWDAMELTTRCGKPWPPSPEVLARAIGEAEEQSQVEPGHAAPSRMTVEELRAQADSGMAWYCDAVSGSDSNPGTEARPFLTIAKGLAASRGITSGTPRSIVLREGTFYPLATIELDTQDSGLSIVAYPGEEPTVSGSLPLKGLQWTTYNVSGNGQMVVMQNTNAIYGCCQPGQPGPGVEYFGKVDNASACQALCEADTTCTAWTFEGIQTGDYANMCYGRTDGQWSPVSESNITSGHYVTGPDIWVADLPEEAKASGLITARTYGMLMGSARAGSDNSDPSGTFDWTRTIRARYPNVQSPETDFFPSGWHSGGVTWGPIREDNTSYTPVYIDTPSDPGALLFHNFQGGYGGHCDIFTADNFSFWCGEHTQGGGAFPFKQPWGADFASGVIPMVIDGAKAAGKMVLHTWREAHWATWDFILDQFAVQPDGSINTNWTIGGFQGARGASEGAEWWLDNAFELLDAPNEFYIDTDEGKVYYFGNNSAANNHSVAVPSGLFAPTVLPVIFNVSGNQDKPVTNLTFDGIRVVGAASSYMLPHVVPSGGDWSLAPYGALMAEGTEGLTVQGCLFERVDGHAVFLRGYHRSAAVTNNEFAWVGSTAIVTFGRSKDTLMDMTEGNYPDGTEITENLIREVGIGPEKQQSCIMDTKTSGSHIADLICINGPRAGINKNENGGPRGPLIERSFIGNQCRESSDHAGFNSWARQPYLFNDAEGNPTVVPEPTVLRNNYIMGNYGSSMTQDNDDGSAYYYSTQNVQYGGGHKSNFGGHNKISDQNLNIYARVYSPTCFSISSTAGPPYVETYINNRCIIDPTVTGNVYDLSVSIDTSNRTNNDFVVGNNTIYVNGGNDAHVSAGNIKTIGELIASGLDPGTTANSTQPTNNEIAQWSADLLGVQWQEL